LYRIISRKWGFAISCNGIAVSEALRTFSPESLHSILCEKEQKRRAIFCCLASHEYGYTGKEAGMATGLE
jgi:hypothetical protein